MSKPKFDVYVRERCLDEGIDFSEFLIGLSEENPDELDMLKELYEDFLSDSEEEEDYDA